jgi:hypothetical protein
MQRKAITKAAWRVPFSPIENHLKLEYRNTGNICPKNTFIATVDHGILFHAFGQRQNLSELLPNTNKSLISNHTFFSSL